jgi:hypothetical protein
MVIGPCQVPSGIVPGVAEHPDVGDAAGVVGAGADGAPEVVAGATGAEVVAVAGAAAAVVGEPPVPLDPPEHPVTATISAIEAARTDVRRTPDMGPASLARLLRVNPGGAPPASEAPPGTHRRI